MYHKICILKNYMFYCSFHQKYIFTYYVYFSDTRIKTKFWGKSMEFQPVGHVNVYLPKQVTNIISPGKFIQFYVGKLLWFKKLLACRLSILQLTYTLVKKKVFNIYFIHLHYNITVLCVDDKLVCKLLVKDSFHMLMIPLYILFIDN